VLILYAISGFVSLGYQVVWFRVFTDWFGATNLVFALVVCNFIGGLGAGALVSKRVFVGITKLLKLWDTLRAYGVIEILISITACATLVMQVIPADTWGAFPYTLVDGIWFQNDTYRSSQLLLAIACVFVPCFFMGTTFPLLCHVFVDEESGGRFPSSLYAWNTLGACGGVTACQFVFLPLVGHNDTYWLLIAINLALGAFFLIAGGGTRSLEEPVPPSSSESEPPERGIGVLIASAIVSGILAGAVEGDMFKRLMLVMPNGPGATMPAISFWAILAIFFGSTLVRNVRKLHLVHIKTAMILAPVIYYLSWRYVYDAIGWLVEVAKAVAVPGEVSPVDSAGFPASNLQLFLFVGLYVFPTFFLISLLLPYVCNRLQTRRKHLGIAYGLNTVAFCIGMIGFTVVAPRVSIFYSLKLALGFLSIGVLFLLSLKEDRRLAIWKPVVTLGLIGVLIVMTPGGFDKDYLSPWSPATRYPVSSMKSNGTNTTFVVTFPDHRRLYFGNISMSGTTPAGQTYMRLMAHVPLLLQDNPTRALLIGFGVGNTASAIAAHDTISQIDAVDLNHGVFETAVEFSESHGDVHLDPRLRFINDDGRGYLNLTDQKYDLITSEPPPPMAAGVYRLYSREYYEAVIARLTPDGMMSQWLPIYQMPAEAVGMAVKTFIAAFPHALMISGHSSELILIGGKLPFAMERIAKRVKSEGKLRVDLNKIRVYDASSIFARVLQTTEELHANYGHFDLISDEKNSLEHLYPSPGVNPTVAYAPMKVLDWFSDQSASLALDLEPVLTHLGRVRYRAIGLPLSGLVAGEDIRLGDLDWERVDLLEAEAGDLLRSGRPARAAAKLLEALEASSEQPWFVEALAELYLAHQRVIDAGKLAHQLLDLEPDSPRGLYMLGAVQVLQGRADLAVESFERALEIEPYNPIVLNDLGWIKATHSRVEVRGPLAAVEYARRASDLSDASPESLVTLAAAYAADSRYAEAIEIVSEAMSLAELEGNEQLYKMAVEHLELYRERRMVIDYSLSEDPG
jgi:spermidine synthase